MSLSRLYVDIDDTLVTWLSDEGGPHPYGHNAKAWQVNEKVKIYAENWKGDLIIWSGGGKNYAEAWANRLLPHLTWTAESKFNAVAGPDDVFIDDMPFDVWKHASIHPDSL